MLGISNWFQQLEQCSRGNVLLYVESCHSNTSTRMYVRVCAYGSEGVKNGWMGEICEGTDSKLTSNSTAVQEILMRVVHEKSCVSAHQFKSDI